METSTIRAFQDILPSWNFKQSSNWAEEFAIKRFHKKMEIPDRENQESRSQQCWDRWLKVDRGLPFIRLPSSEWYRARALIHEWCSTWRLGPVDFSSGSEFTPTRGRNSIESKLSSSEWTCTHDNFGHFARLCYGHKALKRAAKRRYNSYISKRSIDGRAADRFLYQQFKSFSDYRFRCFEAKLLLVTRLVHGSRFSTVPKNNEKDRPINIEPFGNILVQKRVGNGIRQTLKESVGVDLDQLQYVHRERINDLSIATIDLADASDSISLELCRFLLPRCLLKVIESSRSPMVLGFDGDYHLTKKVSSMGNGFTFELMTLILTALVKVLDKNASVFGDDIIIDVSQADRLIQLLEEVGFTVNTDKSFVGGPFRESCGANWHVDFGYIKSFDFKYPTSIHDCIVIYNKIHVLSRDPLYPAFKDFEKALRRTISPALRGVWTHLDSKESESYVTGSSSFLSGYFKCPPGRRATGAPRVKAQKWLRDNCYKQITGTFFAYTFVEKLRTPCLRTLSSRRWAKYEMYLHAGRVQKDVIKGAGLWTRKLMCVVDDTLIIEAKYLTQHR